ncbi:MAG: response regulator transcription factor [Saprospiraceae bacterium]|nr:response regulator transcription factor [Saprospiraceae bacterium]
MAKKKVVLVDDETDILDFLSYNLEKEGFKVSTFSNGEDCLEEIVSIDPDLIILDIMMPGMDGIEVCRKIREIKEVEHTPIAFLTARGEDEMHVSALEGGGDDFIQKPVRPKVFVARVKTLIKRSGRQREKEVLKYDDMTIDQNSMGVKIGKKKVDLVKKEFQLLYLLASRPGRVYSREEILSQVWGTDVIVGDRTIDVHVRKLREKIGSDYIRTVKGVGYKFEF